MLSHFSICKVCRFLNGIYWTEFINSQPCVSDYQVFIVIFINNCIIIIDNYILIYHYISVYHYISLYHHIIYLYIVSLHYYISLYSIIYNYILYTIISLYTIVYHYMIIYHYISLLSYTIVYHYFTHQSVPIKRWERMLSPGLSRATGEAIRETHISMARSSGTLDLPACPRVTVNFTCPATYKETFHQFRKIKNALKCSHLPLMP